ncbi:hypothetical protein HAX54_007073, partial [Datura stramonium]|nr:hypothetical protein [Datura stramonium]
MASQHWTGARRPRGTGRARCRSSPCGFNIQIEKSHCITCTIACSRGIEVVYPGGEPHGDPKPQSFRQSARLAESAPPSFRVRDGIRVQPLLLINDKRSTQIHGRGRRGEAIGSGSMQNRFYALGGPLDQESMPN